MKIKTLRRIRLITVILSLICLSIVAYAAANSMITIQIIVSIITLLMCAVGIIVTCIVIRRKKIEKGLL